MFDLAKEKLQKVKLDFHEKEIEWTLESVNRLFFRGIVDVFDNDLAKCKAVIEKLMKENSVTVFNPNPDYTGQKWCLIDIPKVGLTKLPVAETPTSIKVITVATPVTDPRCIKVFFK